jgi:hypothetical protein
LNAAIANAVVPRDRCVGARPTDPHRKAHAGLSVDAELASQSPELSRLLARPMKSSG